MVPRGAAAPAPLSRAVGFRWIAGTGLEGSGDSIFGSGNVDGSPIVASLADVAATLHKPKGVAYVLRFGFLELRAGGGADEGVVSGRRGPHALD